jgi:predicted nuclease of predicted toxin-antitoxin system
VAKLYSNENFPMPVVRILADKGHDVLTTLDAGKAGAAIPDADVVRFATELDRAVLTLNRKDFIRLHLQSAHHAGIIVCTFDVDFAAQAARILRAIDAYPNLHGQLIRVNRER